MPIRKVQDQPDRNSAWFIGVSFLLSGITLVAGAASLGTVVPRSSEIARAIGEALIVAGAIALAVDRPLKKELLHEVSLGLFKHLIGFDPDPEIKDRIEQLVFNDTRLLCRRRAIQYRIEPLENRWVRVIVETSVEMETPGLHAVDHQQWSAFERAERPSLHRVTLVSPDPQENYDYREPILKSQPPGILEFRCPRIAILPRKTYRFYAAFSMILPEDFYHTYYVGVPTIGIQLSVYAPDSFIVEPDETTHHSGNHWEYPKLFMVGQSLTIRWRPQSPQYGSGQ